MRRIDFAGQAGEARCHVAVDQRQRRVIERVAVAEAFDQAADRHLIGGFAIGREVDVVAHQPQRDRIGRIGERRIEEREVDVDRAELA